MASNSSGLFRLLVLALCCSVAALGAHGAIGDVCTTSSECPEATACSCACARRGHASAAATSAVEPADTTAAPAAEATHAGKGGGVCVPDALRTTAHHHHSSGGGGCKRGKCVCTCTANTAPVALDDDLVIVDPEGDAGPGTQLLDVLGNDVDADGDALQVAPGSVEVLVGDGVQVLGASARGIRVRVADGAEGFVLAYRAQDARGALSAEPAQVRVALVAGGAQLYPGTANNSKTICQGYSVCASEFSSSAWKNNECAVNNRQCSPAPKSATCVKENWAQVAVKPTDSYCLYSAQGNCRNPSMTGCTRCGIFGVVQRCVAGKVKEGATDIVVECAKFPPSKPTHVVVRARTKQGTGLCLLKEHWLTMPVASCAGVEENGAPCVGDPSVAFWQTAVTFGTGKLGANKATWGVQINAPNRRGQQHMHIHVAPYTDLTGPVGHIVGLNSLTGSVATPLRVDDKTNANVFALAAFFPGLKPADIALGSGKIQPFAMAKAMHYNHFTNAAQAQATSYGVGIIPYAKFGSTLGVVLYTAYGFDDTTKNFMSQAVVSGSANCVTVCSAFSATIPPSA